MEWPCLSFDILKDAGGFNRTSNRLYVFKVSDIEQIVVDEDEDDEDLSDDEDATLAYKYFQHNGGINRVRSMPQKANIVATWSDQQKVHIYDIAPLVTAVDAEDPSQQRAPDGAPIYTYGGHPDEGFAMAWSGVEAGKLATGDNRNNIYMWNPNQSR